MNKKTLNDLKKDLDLYLSKLPKEKENYYRLLFEFNDLIMNDYIREYNTLLRRINIVKSNKDITINVTEMNKMRKLVNKYKKILNYKDLSK